MIWGAIAKAAIAIGGAVASKKVQGSGGGTAKKVSQGRVAPTPGVFQPPPRARSQEDHMARRRERMNRVYGKQF